MTSLISALMTGQQAGHKRAMDPSMTGKYAQARAAFSWSLPPVLNLGAQILDAPAAAHPERPAIIEGDTGRTHSFGALAQEAVQLTAALASLGARRGDRVAVIAPQGPRTLIVQAAILRAGLVSVPLSERYGRDALAHRLRDSSTRFAFVSSAGLSTLLSIEEGLASGLPDLEEIICLDGQKGGALGYEALLGRIRSTDRADPADLVGLADTLVPTGPDDPCLMIYTSGTTGPAKGALHGHRVLAGHMPGFLFAHGGAVEGGDVFYTPADWAWAGGLLNLLFPALAQGLPVLAYADREGFNPAKTLNVMARHGVSHAFLPPTALKLMRSALEPGDVRAAGLRSVMSAGEPLGRETYVWAEQALGFPVSEAYGQTECNLVIGSSHRHGVARPGATGMPVPGHDVRVVREDGSTARDDEIGEIAILAPDPVMFLGYWNAADATARKYVVNGTGERLLMTGDMAHRDQDGYLWFKGRDDDVITSSGHRIGPGEIEDSLTGHRAVSMAAVVGVPDSLRTQIVRAFVVLRDGFEPSDALAGELRAHVRATLAAHEYPRDIRFVESLPMTTTGKIIRRMLKDEAD